MIKLGMRTSMSRLMLLLSAALPVPLSFAIPYVSGVNDVLAIRMLVALCRTVWLTKITAYICGSRARIHSGNCIRFIAAGSALGGIFMNQTMAWTIHHYSYTPASSYSALCIHWLSRSSGFLGNVGEWHCGG
jgi:hypothetical protein